MNEEKKTSSFTVKTVIRLISVVATCLFFAPTFMVSCAGQNLNLSAAKIMTGMKYQGETVTEAHLVCILFLVIPIAIIVIWTMKMEHSRQALITGICAAVDIVMWWAMKAEVQNTAEAAACEGKATWLYWVNMLLLLGILVLDVLVFLGKISIEKNLIGAVQNGQNNMAAGGFVNQPAQPTSTVNAGQPMNQPVQPMGQPAQPQNQPGQPATPAFCKSCGTPIGAGHKFCMKCGAKVE